MSTAHPANIPPHDAADWQVVAAHLPPGESVAWVGRPLPGHAAWAGVPGPSHGARVACMALGILAAAPFVVAGVYLCWIAVSRFFVFDRMEVVLGAPLLFTFGFVIALAPPYLLVRPRLYRRQLAHETWYLLTSSHARVVLVRDGAVLDDAALELAALTGAELRYPRADGSGDVVLHASAPAAAARGRGELAFVAVAGAAAVQARAADAIAASRADLAAL